MNESKYKERSMTVRVNRDVHNAAVAESKRRCITLDVLTNEALETICNPNNQPKKDNWLSRMFR